MKKSKLSIVLLLLAGLFVFDSCKKSNGGDGTTTTPEPVPEIQAKWIADSTQIEAYYAGQLITKQTEIASPGDFAHFYNGTDVAISTDGNIDTMQYENQNDQKLILDQSGDRDTLDILTLDSSELILHTTTTAEQGGLVYTVDVTLYSHK